MPLPKLDQPLFNVTLPSTQKTVKFTPFTVKEEKILLMAQESGDIDQMILAMKQIISNCVQDVDIDFLSTFDVEYLMMKLRSKSINNMVEVKITDPDTEEEVNIEIDLDQIEVMFDEKHTKFIQVQSSPEIIIEMEYPKMDLIKTILVGGEDTKQVAFNIMVKCIKSVIQGDEVYQIKDFSKKEVDEFVDGLSMKNMEQIQTFFESMPKIKYEHEYTLKDGTKKKFLIEGTETIFL